MYNVSPGVAIPYHGMCLIPHPRSDLIQMKEKEKEKRREEDHREAE